MLKGNKLRIYPTKQQCDDLNCMFGNDRFIWNQMLNMLNERYQNNHHAYFLTTYELNYLLKQLKVEYPFLKISDSSSLQVTNDNLVKAFQHFFKKISGKPRFHSRKASKQSYTGKSIITIVGKHYLKVPKLGYVKCSDTSCISGHLIKRYTVSLAPTGKYYLAVNYECENQAFKKTDKVVGIDLNASELAIFSNGTHVPSLDTKDLETELRLAQRKLSRRYQRAKRLIQYDQQYHKDNVRELTDFPNYQKQRHYVAKLHAKIANKRNDYLHKLTTYLVKHFDKIVIEDLKVSNMLKNHHLAHQIASQSWYELRRQLTYKCNWYGKKLIVVSPHNTSRICSQCGQKNANFDNLTTNQWLAVRQWICPHCGAVLNRDVNAAINILNKGLA